MSKSFTGDTSVIFVLFCKTYILREEFYEILEDIGMVTNKHEDFVPVNNSESFFVVT
jgi:hypothetical protein